MKSQTSSNVSILASVKMVPGRPEVSPPRSSGGGSRTFWEGRRLPAFTAGRESDGSGPAAAFSDPAEPPCRCVIIFFFSPSLSPLRLPSLCLAVDSAPLSFASLFSPPPTGNRARGFATLRLSLFSSVSLAPTPISPLLSNIKQGAEGVAAAAALWITEGS